MGVNNWTPAKTRIGVTITSTVTCINIYSFIITFKSNITNNISVIISHTNTKHKSGFVPSCYVQNHSCINMKNSYSYISLKSKLRLSIYIPVYISIVKQVADSKIVDNFVASQRIANMKKVEKMVGSIIERWD